MSGLLEVNDLSLSINGIEILKSISFQIQAGQVLGVVGESGSGKSLTAFSIMQLLPAGSVLSGQILLDGQDIAKYDDAQMCALRGREIGMAFQEPMTALNPVQSIGRQVSEVYQKHLKLSKPQALEEAAKILTRVGLPPSEIPLSRYPFELSGGQRQRVVIALAVALKPKLLIADEPTSALDVSTEAQVLKLLKTLCDEDNIALLFISHDLAAIAQLSDTVAVMKEGEIVEQNKAASFFKSMSHSYSIALYEASQYTAIQHDQQEASPQQQMPSPIQEEVSPRQEEASPKLIEPLDKTVAPILDVKNLSCAYNLPRQFFFSKPNKLLALQDINFHLMPNESLGLVGESGSGKSTLVRAVLGLKALESGSVWIDGKPFTDTSSAAQKALRKQIQVVFQDPYGSFNPRHKISKIVSEPLFLLGSENQRNHDYHQRVSQVLRNVGLSASDADKYPHEFSGGQRQRIAIARALVVEPSIVVFDEATSALDVSVRAQILDLLNDLSTKLGISYLIVSHDLEVVRVVTDRVLILQQGKIVEQGATSKVFASPSHPYTKSLLESKPSLQSTVAGKNKDGGEYSNV